MWDAADHYDRETAGLAERFMDAVQQVGLRVLQFPKSGKCIEDEVRSRVVRGFPYSLLYLVEPTGIYVVAVKHQHRKPGYWRYRLQS